MSGEDAVDAGLAGLDAGEDVTIPGLHEADAWTDWGSQPSLDLEQVRGTPSRPRTTACLCSSSDDSAPNVRLLAPYACHNALRVRAACTGDAEAVGKLRFGCLARSSVVS